jgi:hypothetical protein
VNSINIPLRVRILNGKEGDETHDLRGQQILIGKNKKCDIVLSDDTFSDYEILIGISCDGSYFIRPLRFSQELVINGKIKKNPTLQRGDLISFGALDAIFEGNPLPKVPRTLSQYPFEHDLLKMSSFENDFIHFDERIKEATPLDQLSFSYISTEGKEIPKNCEKLIQEKNNILLQIRIYSCGILISEEKRKITKKEYFVTSEEEKKVSCIGGPLFESGKMYPFLRRKNSGEVFIKSLPGFNGLDEVSAKEGRSNEWKKMNVEEELTFLKGPNKMVVSLLEKEKKLSHAPLFKWEKIERNMIGLSLLLFLFFMSLSLWVKPDPKKITPQKELMVTFYDVSEIEKKSFDQIYTPEKKSKLIQKKKMALTTGRILKPKKVKSLAKNKMKKIKKKKNRQLNDAISTFLKDTSFSVTKKNNGVEKKKTFLGIIKKGKTIKMDNKKWASLIEGKGKRRLLKGWLKRKKKEEFIQFSSKTVFLGSMDPDLIRKILKKYLPQFKFCYQQELTFGKRKKGGTVDLKFSINPFGKVNNILIGFKKKDFSSKGVGCMKKVLSMIPFPKPKGGGSVRVRQPLNFSTERGAFTL